MTVTVPHPVQRGTMRKALQRRRGLMVVFFILLFFNIANWLSAPYVHPLHPGGLYLEHPRRFWTLAPGWRWDRQIGQYVYINALGLRGPDMPAHRPALSVLLLGDSCIYGAGVPSQETIDRFLEKRLESITGRTVQVYNGGCPGYSSYQGYDLLEEVGWKIRADIVVIEYMYGDSYRDIVPDNQRLGGPVAGWIRTWLWKNPFYCLLRDHFRSPGDDLTDCLYKGNGNVFRVSLTDYAANLHAIARLARRQGARTLIFLRMPQRDLVLPPMQPAMTRPGEKPEMVPMPQPTTPQPVGPPVATPKGPQAGPTPASSPDPPVHDPSWTDEWKKGVVSMDEPLHTNSYDGVLLSIGRQEGIAINGLRMWKDRTDRKRLFWDVLHFNGAGCRVFANDLAKILVEENVVTPHPPPDEPNRK